MTARLRFIVIAVAPALLALGGACSSKDDNPNPDAQPAASNACGAGSGTETYSANMSKTGDAGIEVRLLDATPAPPAQADNTWTLSVAGTDGGALSGATLDVVPFMPEHGHGANVAPQVADNGDGTYTVSRITFIMPGVWETTVEVTAADGTTDQVVFSFCIE